MVSTGEVACLGDDFNKTFLKSLIAVGLNPPKKNVLLSTGPIESKAEFLESTKLITQMGLTLFATKGTAQFLEKNGIPSTVLHWPLDQKEPNTLTYIANGTIDMVINIPKNIEKEELDNDYLIRRKAVDFNVPLITNLQLAKRYIEAMSQTTLQDLDIKSWDEYT